MFQIRAEPLVKVLKNIKGLSKWSYQLWVFGGAYYFIVSYEDNTAYYRISEVTGLNRDFFGIEFPLELARMLYDMSLKPAATLDISVEIVEEAKSFATIRLSNYEEEFETKCVTEYFLPEDLLHKRVGYLKEFSNFSKLYGDGNEKSSVLLAKETYVLLSEDFTVASFMSTSDYNWICFGYPKFVDGTLSRFLPQPSKKELNPPSAIEVYESSKTYALHCASSLKLSSKEVLALGITVIIEPHEVMDDTVNSLHQTYHNLLEAKAISISSEKLLKQKQFIEQEQLKEDELVKFAGDRKIQVKDFLKFLYKQKDSLTSIHLKGNMVLVRTPEVDTLFTLYDKVVAQHEHG